MDDDDDLFIDAPGDRTPRPMTGPPRPPAPRTRWNRTVLTVLGLLVVALVVAAAAVVATSGSDDEGDAAASSTTAGTEVAGASVTAPTDSTLPRSEKPIWPYAVQGRPTALGPEGTAPADIPPGAAPGVYLWTDFKGWHVWVVNGEGIAGVVGAVVSDAEIERAEPAADGEADVEIINNVIKFELPGDVPVAGVDFNPGFFCNQLRFQIDSPVGPYAPEQIRTGGFSVPTTTSPLILERARY